MPWQVWKPSMPGIMISRTTSVGCWFSTSSMADLPSRAVITW